MKAQFFIISSVIMVYVIILTFQYLTGFSDIRITRVEKQELSYIQGIKESLYQTFNISNSTSNGNLSRIIKDIVYTENFFKKELLKKGIEFDNKFIIFSNGFETGLSEWTGTSGTPEIVNNTKYGSFSLYSNGIEYVYKNLSGINGAYVRVYVNFKTIPLSSDRYYFISIYDNNNQILALGLYNDNNDYKLVVYFEPTNQNFYSQPIYVNEGEWHYFEVYWFENSTESKIKAWYDGNLKIDETIDSQGGGKMIDEYRFGGIGGGTPDFYIDCAAISNEYIGEECFPDEEPYFVFSLRSSNLFTKTGFSH